MKILSASALILCLSLSSPALAIQAITLTDLGSSKRVRAELILPDGKGPFPGVLVLHTGSGFKKYDLAYGESLAHAGYAVLIPHYFEPYSLTYDTRNWATTVYAESILNDFKAEIQYLKAQPFIKKARVGAVGFSMGGYWALILAAKRNVAASVSYYGDLTGGGLSNAEFKYRFINTFSEHSSPVLILHGADDMSVPVRFARDLANLLKAKFAPYELRIYPDAGQRFERGNTLHAPAAQDSLKRTLTFLKKYLNPPINSILTDKKEQS